MDLSSRTTVGVAVAGVCVVVAVVAFGGFLGGGGGQAPADASPAGPAGVGENASLPPGVNESGLVDVDALVAAHRESMAAASVAYTFAHERTMRYPNGSTTSDLDVTGTVRIESNLTGMNRTVDRDRPYDETTVVWTNASAGYERVVDDGTSYTRRYQGPPTDAPVHYMLPNALAVGEWNLTNVSDDGTRFVLVADGPGDGTPGDAKEAAVYGRAVVDSEGRIHELHVRLWRRYYEHDVEGRMNTNRTLDYDVTAVGNVSVGDPGWLSAARNATGNDAGAVAPPASTVARAVGLDPSQPAGVPAGRSDAAAAVASQPTWVRSSG
jgi:hypothetical protein